MTVDDLIRELESVREDHGGDTPVRLAIQPSWPFQHTIDSVEAVDLNAPDESEYPDREEFDSIDDYWKAVHEWEKARPDTDEQVVCYIAEGGQYYDAPYLPGAAKNALGWGRGR
jgi:hypothetical protein